MTGDEGKKPSLFRSLFGRSRAEAEPATPAEPSNEVDNERLDNDLLPANSSSCEPSRDASPDEVRIGIEPKGIEPKRGWLSRLTSGLAKTSTKLTDGITGIFTKRRFDAATIEDFEDLLLSADLGLETTKRITGALGKTRFERGLGPDEVRAILAQEVANVLRPVARPLTIDKSHRPHVILVIGVNGAGKTTTIGKLAAQYKRSGHSVLIAAGDTFRAAAIDQLKVWGERAGVPVLARAVGSESSALAYDAVSQARGDQTEILMIDTAGRLQNKAALMDELEKVIRVIKKLDPTAPHEVVLVLDATTGQNAMNQVDVFAQRAGVTGLVMTKLDGTARGGILVAIAAKYGLPVYAIGVGEGIDDLAPFDCDQFAQAIAQI